MIESLTYKKVEKPSQVAWADKVEYLQRNPTTQFKPGLNILYGANGSGKSTLLKMLALSLAAEQGGTSVVTHSWVSDMLGIRGDGPQLNFEVVHDGQPAMFFDARAKEGLVGGSFDDDFFNLGIFNTMAKGSTGQLGLHRISRMLNVLTGEAERAAQEDGRKKANARAPKGAAADGKKPRTSSSFKRKAAGEKHELIPNGFPQSIEWKIHRGASNETWTRRFAQIDALLAAKAPTGPKTLLFDEPESGYAMGWQAGLWKNIFSQVNPQEFQLIVATHSPFALRIPGANYIEMSPGYLQEAEVAIATLFNRFAPA